MPADLRQTMLREMADKTIFRQVQQYAFDYADQVRDRHVAPDATAIAGLDQFTEDLPAAPNDAESVLAQLNQYGADATTAQMGGRYFGFVNGGVIPAALAARWLSDFWDQNSALYVMSPLASKLEAVCEGWLRELLDLPERVVAGFVSGSSLAIFCGLAAARYRIFSNNGWDINKQGFHGAPKVRLIAGRQAHGTVVKAISLLGFGTDNIEWVDVDDQGRIIAEQVPALDGSCILILQAGHVSTGAFDDFESLCQKANDAGAWVHIDGAFGLWVAASQRLKHLTKGMERANSFSLDGHKTLNTPYDNGLVLCDDQDALVHALHASGSYIVHSAERDGMFYTPEMSRRARSIELWAALKYLGKAGVDELVYGLHQRAVQMAGLLRDQGFNVLNDVVFNQVMVACETDELTEQTMLAVQQSGECWAGGASWQGKKVIRISVCSWVTTEDDIRRSATAFINARNSVQKN